MKGFALSTGSSGNCFYVESKDGCKVLVDLGLTYQKTEELLLEKGIKIEDIDAVCITHEHTDHIIGLKGFLKKTKIPIYISKGTYEEACDFKVSEKSSKINIVREHDVFKLKDMSVLVLGKPHDSKESISFIFDDKDKKLGVFTDLGHVTNEIKHMLKTLDLVFFEANYCHEYIKNSETQFPRVYLERLTSNYGHLGVDQTIDALVDCCHDNQKIVLSHVSENTNSYENVYSKIRTALDEVSKFPELIVGFHGEVSDWIE